MDSPCSFKQVDALHPFRRHQCGSGGQGTDLTRKRYFSRNRLIVSTFSGIPFCIFRLNRNFSLSLSVELPGAQRHSAERIDRAAVLLVAGQHAIEIEERQPGPASGFQYPVKLFKKSIQLVAAKASAQHTELLLSRNRHSLLSVGRHRQSWSRENLFFLFRSV